MGTYEDQLAAKLIEEQDKSNYIAMGWMTILPKVTSLNNYRSNARKHPEVYYTTYKGDANLFIKMGQLVEKEYEKSWQDRKTLKKYQEKFRSLSQFLQDLLDEWGNLRDVYFDMIEQIQDNPKKDAIVKDTQGEITFVVGRDIGYVKDELVSDFHDNEINMDRHERW